ncbi:hypothetical protein [Streptomyces sp. TP-A0356]|uniref:hypothetical protein n=1 Tax=Streptomyces sp. TP-A0356 TaxID=1359208 RepID=UPI00131A843B|nr:hypothetical protein [Streptomyces sp. TP-A0356]
MTWNEPEDQIPVGGGTLWHESISGDALLKGCSDLLEDFLEKIGDMQSEYLRALDGAS